ncbi:MAG: hypothetical protein DRI57_29135 [Deltaproteobacteria bacterium]|nr:MAG: hypothetical protein DRI57_29135 [Deltaproteobacteria bacterium]
MTDSALAARSYEDHDALYKKSSDYSAEGEQNFSSALKREMYERIKPELRLITDETVDLPEKGGLTATELKYINREVLRKIPPGTREMLIEERQALVRKKFKKGLIRKEENRLRLIDWELDRIDDAELGEELDRLEYFVRLNEQFASELKEMMDKF